LIFSILKLRDLKLPFACPRVAPCMLQPIAVESHDLRLSRLCLAHQETLAALEDAKEVHALVAAKPWDFERLYQRVVPEDRAT